MIGEIRMREVERLLWLVFAALAWNNGLSIEAAAIGRDSAISIMLFVSSYGLGLAALVAALDDRRSIAFRGALAFGFFLFFSCSYAIVDALVRARTPYTHTTDAHVFMDYAARLLLHGKNPYDQSLFGAYSVHLMPSDLQTPLRNGGLSDRLAYPSLSFLLIVPFVELGIDSRWLYALAFIGSVTLVYYRAPKELRPLALLPFVANHDLLAFCLGGVTDAVWAFFLCAAVVTWKKKWAPAIFFGLACAYKQHPWLLAPFLFVRIYRETTPADRRAVLVRFFGVAAAVTIVLNVPFIVWSPGAWVRGIVESLANDMAPYGDGLSAAVALGGASLPKWLFAIAFWGIYFALIPVCARWRHGKILVWIAPSIAFFFNYRSLSSYWYYNFFPFVAELAGAPIEETAARVRTLGTRKIAAIALAVCAIPIGALFYSRAHAGDLVVIVQNPIRTWSEHATRMDLVLTNHSGHEITPRFWVQGANFQTLPWRVDKGSPQLAAGATEVYSISAIHRISEFDVAKGARVTVTDINSEVRSSIVIAPDDSWGSPLAIPNESLRFWDVSSGAPTFWTATEEGSPGAFVAPSADGKGITLRLESDLLVAESQRLLYCRALPSCWSAQVAGPHARPADLLANDHAVHVSTELVYHDAPLSLWVQTPDGANRAPSYEERYGLDVWFGDNHVLVLLGGEPGEGTLTDGVRFVVAPGPRGEWHKITIDLGALEKKYGANAYPGLYGSLRVPLVDVPMLPMRLALTYASHAKENASATFGPIEGAITGKMSPDDAFAELERHPGQIDAYRGEYEHQLRNPSRALEYMHRATREESHPSLELRAARIALDHRDYDEARAGFTRAIAAYPVEAHGGLGWTAFATKDYVTARSEFDLAQRALEQLAKEHPDEHTGDDEVMALNIYTGVALSAAVSHDCVAARQSLAKIPEFERKGAVTLPELSSCVSPDGGPP